MAIFISRNPYRMTKRIIWFVSHSFRAVILLTVVPSHWKGYKDIWGKFSTSSVIYCSPFIVGIFFSVTSWANTVNYRLLGPPDINCISSKDELQWKVRASVLLRSSFVRVVSVTFLPNIEMNSIYYDVLKLNLKPVNRKTLFRWTLLYWLVLKRRSVYKPI